MQPRAKLLSLVATTLIAASCGGSERRPNVPESGTVRELRESAGAGVQDCGEATESKTDTTCRIHPVGECIETALKQCRPAFGVREYFTDEGDSVRDDWLVLSDGQGGCQLVLVDDRSADPLAPRKPSIQVCDSIEWKAHATIPNCEAPNLMSCHAKKKAEDSGDKSAE